jgi:putative ABC transport system permease protein
VDSHSVRYGWLTDTQRQLRDLCADDRQSVGNDIRIQGKPEPGSKDEVFADRTRITPGFFDTIGARMLAGRAVNEDDNGNTRHVAVINDAFAKKFFGNQNPIGQHFGPASVRNAGTYEIVGVVQNIHYVTWGCSEGTLGKGQKS